MEKSTFSDGEVAEYVNKQFVNINLDANRAEKESKQFKIEAIPATFLVDKGEIIAKHIGYLDPKKYVRWLKGCVEANKEIRALLPKLEESKNDSRFNGTLGSHYLKLGVEDKGLDFLRRSLSLAESASDKPLQAEALGRLIEAYSNSEEHAQSLTEALAKARAVDPEGKLKVLDDVLMHEALAALSKEDLKKASEIVTDALNRFPDSDRMDALLTIHGFLLWKLKDDKDGAVKVLKQVVEKYPESDWAPTADHLVKDVTGEHKH